MAQPGQQASSDESKTHPGAPEGAGGAEKRLPSLPELIAEAERELGQRRKHYPRWVADGRLAREVADHREACQEEILKVLLNLRLGLSYTAHFLPQPSFGLTPELAASLERAGFKDLAQWIGAAREAMCRGRQDASPLFDKKQMPGAAASKSQQGSLL
jgi:hypothetical protein